MAECKVSGLLDAGESISESWHTRNRRNSVRFFTRERFQTTAYAFETRNSWF